MTDYEQSLSQVSRIAAAVWGEQVSLSYPMPDVTQGVWVERYFLYPMGNRTERSRPFAQLVVSMENGQLLRMQDCRLGDFMDPDEHPFSKPIRYRLDHKMTVKEFQNKQAILRRLYAKVRTFVFRDELTEEETEILRKYWALLLWLEPKALHPYYQKMGKNFYRWGYFHVQRT